MFCICGCFFFGIFKDFYKKPPPAQIVIPKLNDFFYIEMGVNFNWECFHILLKKKI